MTCHVFRAPYIRFRLHVEQQPIVERMRGFGSAIDVWIFVTRQAVPEFMFEGCGQRTVKIPQVKKQAAQ